MKKLNQLIYRLRKYLAKKLDPDALPVTVTIVRCNFDGKNPDGSGVFTYHDDNDFIKSLSHIHLDGWYCYSAEKHAELMEKIERSKNYSGYVPLPGGWEGNGE